MEKKFNHNMTVEEKLFHHLRGLSHVMQHSADLRGGQGRILALLSHHENMSQRELQQMLGIQPGSLSEVLAKLEASGHIERKPNEQDKRNVDIALTTQGIICANEALSNRREMQQTLFQALTPEEKESLLSLLKKLSADWQQKFPKPEGRHGHGGPHHHGGCL